MKPHPDDKLMIMLPKVLLKVLRKLENSRIPIGDEEMAHYVTMVDKLILTGGQNVDLNFMVKKKRDSDDYHLQRVFLNYSSKR